MVTNISAILERLKNFNFNLNEINVACVLNKFNLF